MKLTAFATPWVVATISLAAGAPPLVDPPDVELNATTGLIETVDSAWAGSNYNVRFTEATVAGELRTTSALTSHAANDLDPRISCSAKGDLVVVWWRDLSTDAVMFRSRAPQSALWAPERALGIASESASRPRIVQVGDKAWVAYQIQKSASRCVGAQVIDDDAEPMRSIVATTTYGGNLDIQITYESGHLWITWIDSSSRVGYSEFNPTTLLWSPVAVESYAPDSIAAARARIRGRILSL